MERILTVVFDNETEACEGMSVLRQLQREGEITVYADAVIAKLADGSVSVKQSDEPAPLGTILGTTVGGLIGLLAGPLGMAAGAVSGLTFGGIFDIAKLSISADFVEDVSKSLTANKVAVVAEIDEQWTTPIDTRMEALGGTVFRRAVWQVRDEILDQDIAAMTRDLAQFKQELADARADRRAKLQQKIDQLQAKIDAQQKKVQARHETFAKRQLAKKELLMKNAAAAGRALKELATTPI
ncbi:MAG TPA: DUF1269 domain-containing protein [Thermoanaerobaculia bacterium]|nr:DUF1269 domain-containing protein [Thermoanaerobaculia bacterium]